MNRMNPIKNRSMTTRSTMTFSQYNAIHETDETRSQKNKAMMNPIFVNPPKLVNNQVTGNNVRRMTCPAFGKTVVLTDTSLMIMHCIINVPCRNLCTASIAEVARLCKLVRWYEYKKEVYDDIIFAAIVDHEDKTIGYCAYGKTSFRYFFLKKK